MLQNNFITIVRKHDQKLSYFLIYDTNHIYKKNGLKVTFRNSTLTKSKKRKLNLYKLICFKKNFFFCYNNLHCKKQLNCNAKIRIRDAIKCKASTFISV